MDWKYQRFEREALLQAPRETVLEAARSFAAESLADWQLADTADGFEARGRSASHTAAATFRIETAPFGTKVAVTLLVERAGPLGFMLFDIGGYYEGQLRKWLEGIQWNLHPRHPSATPLSSTEPEKPAMPGTLVRASSCFTGCLLVLIFCPLPIWFICAVIGLLTGQLFLPGVDGMPSTTLHDPWARIVSILFLLFFAWLFRMFKKGR
jgi:hypothetical protein